MAFTTRAQSTRPPVGFFLMIALLALCAGGKAILYDTMDPDCFWHLRVADQLHRQGIGPIVDDISFASSKDAWTPYSWLAELGMKAIWDVGGYRAAVATQAIMQSLIIVFIALACVEMQGVVQPRRRKGAKEDAKDFSPFRYLPVVMATAVAGYLSLAYFSFRPVTAAFVILSMCTWLILRDRRMGEQSLAVWTIVPLTVLLTNIHLFSFFVPAVMLAMLIGAFVERRLAGSLATRIAFSPTEEYGSQATRLNVEVNSVRRYSILFFTTTLAFFATPMLPGLIRTAFFYSAKDKMVTGPVIAEMQSFARGPMGIIAALIVAGIITCAVVNWRRMRIGEMICLIAGTILLVKLGRFSPVFAMAACPVLAATFPKMSDRVLAKPAICGLLAGILVIGSWRVMSAFPRQQTLAAWLNRHGPDAPGYPTAAADFVRSHVSRSTGHLVNEFSWGGYLAYELGDRYQILLDGRTQVYPAQVWHATYLGTESDRQQYLSTVSADAAVLPSGKSQFRSALEHLGWTSAFKDDRAEVMLPPGAVARIDP